MADEKLPVPFLDHAAGILGDTVLGLSGHIIVRETNAYAVKFNVDIPHTLHPFEAPNKRTALFENMMLFSGQQQYQIISDLCNHSSLVTKNDPRRQELKKLLVTRYPGYAPNAPAEINAALIAETRHWLDGYPEALTPYNNALTHFTGRIFLRNLLDDLRLALEMLLRAVLVSEKSLENQLGPLGTYITNRGGSKELANMFVKLVDYYAKYQNSYVKHNDAVIEEEIEFIFEITSSFMKHLIRLQAKDSLGR